jgi:hypothetical protein
MIELLLNGYSFDLTGEDDVALSFAASKLQDIQSRNGDFSTTFKVPLTNKVRQAIEFSNLFNSTNRYPYTIAEAEIKEQGATIIRGFARIEAVKSSLEVVIFGGNSNWFDLIKEKSLRDLDLSDLDLVFTVANVEANRLNDYTKGFVFPNALYGGFAFEATPFTLYDFFPAIYCYRIFLQIFTDIGWNVYGDLIDDSLFKKMVLPFTNEFIGNDNYLFGRATIDLTSFFAITGSTSGYIGIDAPTIDPIFCVNDGPTTGLLSSAASFEIFDKNLIEVRGAFIFNISTTGSTFKYTLVNKTTGSEIEVIGERTIVTTGLNAAGFYYVGELEPGFYSIKLECSYTGGIGTISQKLLELKGVKDFHFRRNTIINQTIDMASTLPDIKQVDFVKAMLNSFNCITLAKVDAKELQLLFFDKIINNKHNAIDYSNFVDKGSEIELLYMDSSYAQENYLKYLEDDGDSFLIPFDGDGSFLIANENLELTKDVYESVFSQSTRTQVAGKTFLILPIRVSEIVPRVAYIEITNNNLVTQFTQSAPSQSAELFFENLKFSNLIDSHYANFVEILQDFKLLKIYLAIKSSHIATLDFGKPLFLDFECDSLGHVSGYFYVNLVDQYKPGAAETTLLELVRI